MTTKLPPRPDLAWLKKAAKERLAELREDFMRPLGLTANRLAINLRFPAARIGEIINGRRAITADTALRLARYFGTSPQFWTNLRSNYEIELAQDAPGKRIEDEIKPHRAA